MSGDEVDRQIAKLERDYSRAGVPTARHNLRPKTTPVLYRDVQKGDVIMERAEHPVVVLRRSGSAVVDLVVRYVWQSDAETPWPLGPFPGDALVAKAVTRRGARS